MAFSKVILNGDTLMDVTQKSVAAGNLRAGETALGADGNDVVGAYDPGTVTPEMFGAVGDGVADDTEAVQTAINHGGIIVCGGTYRITGDVYLRNPQDTGDNSAFPRSKIVGKNGGIAILSSSAIIDWLQPNQATFIHDGGRFVFKYTANVEFHDCVFIGAKTNTKTDIAFYAPESPYRRLHIENCTFANFDCAIYGYQSAGADVWSGECILDTLYFALCNYCICLENGGYDSFFTNCIAQGSCGYFLRLTNASGALIRGNHDYSQNGCVIYGAASIIGNYFDGLCKLHVKGYVGSEINSPKYSPTITANSFLVNAHDDGWRWVIAVDEHLFGAVVCDNIIIGGDGVSTVFFNLKNAEYFYQNIVRNNTGKITGYVSNTTTASMTLYGNDIDMFRLYVDAGTGTKVYDKFYWASKSATCYCKYETPTRFYLRGTTIDGLYSDVLSFIKVKLANNTEDSATFAKDGASLNNEIATKWGYDNIAEIEAEIHVNFGVVPTEGYPSAMGTSDSESYATNINGVTIPTAPDFSDDE